MSHIPPPAWRQPRATATSTAPSSTPAGVAPVLPRDRSIWPGMLLIVGIPTILFAIEYAMGVGNA